MKCFPDNERLIAVSESVVGRVRVANEDSCDFAATVNGDLFVVCDGMGGHVGGAVASGIAVSCIIKYLSESSYENIPKAIKNALLLANEEIIARAEQEPSLKGMGTTACVLLVKDGNAWIAHVGDSRIYLYTASDRILHRVTKDHSFVQSLVDAGELDDRQAENHPRKNVILKALGIRDRLVVNVDEYPILPARGDVFLICSDGLSGMMNDDELEFVLQRELTLTEKLETLINSANAEGKGTDNITAQLIRIINSTVEESYFPDYNPQWRKMRYNQLPAASKASPSVNKHSWIWILLVVFAAMAVSFSTMLAFSHLKSVRERGNLRERYEIVDKNLKELLEDSTKVANRFNDYQKRLERSLSSYTGRKKALKNVSVERMSAEISALKDSLDNVNNSIQAARKEIKEIERQISSRSRNNSGFKDKLKPFYMKIHAMREKQTIQKGKKSENK